LLGISATHAFGQTQTYSAANADDSPALKTLRMRLEAGDSAAVQSFWAGVSRNGTPLIEPIANEAGYSFVTFLWRGNEQTWNVVIFDGVAAFDAKDRMLHLAGTDVWYKTYRVRNDARFAYNLSPNDSLQSFDDVKGDKEMRNRLAMLQVDPLNPRRCPTTFGDYGAESSYVELPNAGPLTWESSTEGLRRGRIEEAAIHSEILKSEEKVWVYTPAGFKKSGSRYPVLVLFDGDRNIRWIPKILDLLIARGKLPPMVAVLTDQSVPSVRRDELPCNPRYADFLANELAPWARQNYYATAQPERTVVAGASLGGLASVFAGLKHPEVFGKVISLSGSFWWKPDGDTQGEWLVREVSAAPKQPLRLYLEVGLMESFDMQVKTNRDMAETMRAKGYPAHFFEYDGSHAFLNWSEGMVSGLEYLLGADSPPQ
jgi:enterochelin esterase-like enzyme